MKLLTMLDTPVVINPKADVGQKSLFLPQLGGSHRNIAIMFGMEKLEWCVYLTVNNFDRIQECDRQTDRHHTMA